MAPCRCLLAAVAFVSGDLALGFSTLPGRAASSPAVRARLYQASKDSRWASTAASPVPQTPCKTALRRHVLAAPLKAVTQDSTSRHAPILVTGNNVEVTEPIKEYIEKKVVNVLDKVGSSVSKVDVHLSVNKNPRVTDNHLTEVTVFAKDHVFRATDASDSMYASIDLVADRMRRKLRRYKERKVDSRKHRQGVGSSSRQVVEVPEVIPAEVAEEDPFEDKYGEPEVAVDMSVVKKKSFPMPPISVEEAVLCLEYIEHDFYLFRNVETNEVNVVYKRNSGGVGHIQPEAEE